MRVSNLYVVWAHDRVVLSLDAANEGRALVRLGERPVAIGELRALVDRLVVTYQVSLRTRSTAALRKARELGATLADRLLEPRIAQALARLPGDYLVIQHDERLSWIPWELLSLDDQILGVRLAVGRRVKTRLPFDDEPPAQDAATGKRVLIVSDPTGDLPMARLEGDELRAALESAGYRVTLLSGKEASTSSVGLALSQHTLFHYCGHAHSDPSASARSGLVLSDGLLSPKALRSVPRLPAIVFLNACSSAVMAGPEAELPLDGLAGAWLTGGGRHFLGSLWRTPDSPPTVRFCLDLYARLLDSEPVGTAVLGAKRGMLASAAPAAEAWASVVLYGDPSERAPLSTPTVRSETPSGSPLDAAVELESQGEYSAALELYTRLSDSPGLETPSDRALMLLRRGRLQIDSGRFKEALSSHKEAATLDPQLRPDSLLAHALVYCHWGDARLASALLDEVASLLFDEDPRRAHVAHYRGLVARLDGNRAAAAEFLDRALALYHGNDDAMGISRVLDTRARVHLDAGDDVLSYALFVASLAIKRSLNDQWGVGIALGGMAEVERRRGRYRAAMTLLREDLAIVRNLENRRLEFFLLLRIAECQALVGESEHARAALAELAKVAQTVDDGVEALRTSQLFVSGLEGDPGVVAELELSAKSHAEHGRAHLERRSRELIAEIAARAQRANPLAEPC